MRLTLRTNLAMRALMYCAAHQDRMVTKAEIARACNASENHLAQVINALGQSGFLQTQRGRTGGMRLGARPETISVGAVFRHFEADTPFTECFSLDSNACPLSGRCLLKEALSNALEAFYKTLDRVTLSDLVDDPAALAHLRALSGTAPVMACRSGVTAARH
ncbi:RrF2 family transcriptional regulator [Frigidibacter sp. MR17.24]|uniref:RrF2 family transcriptional regulator n=1 Tax=Frigidibacter sp. MR17.24 TaxID=3127345 RepID=UPI003012C841